MPEEYDDEPEGLDRPPSFFPYDADAPEREPADYGEPVEVSIEGVYMADTGGNIQRFVMLTDGERRIPIMIGPFEATAISMSLEGTTPDRPLTHDLMRTVVERLDGVLEKVVIDDLWSTTYYAKLTIRKGEETIEIDSRPSDAIALALRFECAIFVSEGILEQAGDA